MNQPELCKRTWPAQELGAAPQDYLQPGGLRFRYLNKSGKIAGQADSDSVMCPEMPHFELE
ncbi:hypothetical protein [Paenibacillus sp. FSL R10-2771]|uniref:hypothetical protein n=1 Tax=Paenibacillus sp. FSL R10-2771 TaxID=2954693 RepID=UPI0030F84706